MTAGAAFRRRTTARGVTYVELLVVATVVGVLATLAIPTGLTFWRGWKERQLRRALAEIRVALDAYHADWERGCIEASTEKGWPESLEELAEPKELTDLPQCQPGGGASGQGPSGTGAGSGDDDDAAPAATKQYLRRVPKDPFNEEDEEHDVSGWKARAYDDDWDASSWGGDDVYDVYSSSSLRSLAGTRYEEW